MSTVTIGNVIARRDGSDFVVGDFRFVLDEHDNSWILRGPDREPEGFRSIAAGLRTLISEGRFKDNQEKHQPFVDRTEAELLVAEFERGVQQLIECAAMPVAFEEAAQIATQRMGELYRKSAARYRYDRLRA